MLFLCAAWFAPVLAQPAPPSTTGSVGQVTVKPVNTAAQNAFFSANPEVNRALGRSEFCLGGIAGLPIPEVERQIGNYGYQGIGSLCDAGTAAINGAATAMQMFKENPNLTAVEIKLPEQKGINNVIFAMTDELLAQRTSSGVVFAMDSIQRIGSPGAVNAASPYFPGSGFQLMSPIQNFWGWAVTIAYSLMILVIIAIAFALLFRARLDGKNVVKMEQAIPGIVMAMVLIPLSYPISGLFIDAITVGSNAIHGILFSESGIARDLYTAKTETTTNNSDTGGNSFVGLENVEYSRNLDDTNDYGGEVQGRGLYADDPRLFWMDMRGLMFTDFSRSIFAQGNTAVCNPNQTSEQCEAVIKDTASNGNLGFKIADTVMQGVNSAGPILGPVINFVYSIVMLVTSFRIFWHLFKKFISGLFLPIGAVFVFATLAVPGRGLATIMNFIKVLFSVSACFIAAYGMILLSIVFSHPGFVDAVVPGGSVGAVIFNPPFLFPPSGQGQAGAGTTFGIDPGFIFMMVGVMIFLSIKPTLVAIDKALGADKPLPAFLATPLREFNSAADIAFRPTTALAASAAGIAANNIATPIYRRFMNAPRGDFSNTRADQMKEDYAKRSENLRAQGGWLNNARAALNDWEGNLRMRAATGKSNEVAKRSDAGKNPFAYEILLDPKYPGYSEPSTNFSLDIRTLNGNMVGGTANIPSRKVEVVLKAKGEDVGKFPGAASLQVRGGSLGVLTSEKGGTITIRSDKDPAVNTGYQGKDKLTFGATLEFTGITRDNLNLPFKMKDDDKVKAQVEGVQGYATGDFTIYITSDRRI